MRVGIEGADQALELQRLIARSVKDDAVVVGFATERRQRTPVATQLDPAYPSQERQGITQRAGQFGRHPVGIPACLLSESAPELRSLARPGEHERRPGLVSAAGTAGAVLHAVRR